MNNASLLDATGVPHFRPGGITPLDNILSAASERVRKRLNWLADRIEYLDSAIEGAAREVESTTEGWEIAKTNLAKKEQASVIPGSGITEDQIAAERGKVRAANDRRLRAMQRQHELIRERESDKVNHGSGGALLFQKRATASEAQEGAGRLAGDEHQPVSLDLEEVDVDVPETADDCRALVAEVAREISAAIADREEVKAAWPPAAYAVDSVRLKLERLKRAGKPGVSTPSAEEDMSIIWPTKALKAAGRADFPGERPQVIDVEALAARYWGDQILADIEAEIGRAYAGVTLVLEPHEKRKRLRQIDAKILAAERRECAARWRLIEDFGDESISFRPGTNPRALLGIA